MKNFIYFAAALVFLIVGVQSQSESQLQCFANFFVDPNNQQALEEISDVCDGLTFEESSLPEVCEDPSSPCFSRISTIFNSCGSVTFADRCRLLTIPRPSLLQSQCIDDAEINNANDVSITCGSLSPTNVEQLDILCSNEDCRDLINQIIGVGCQFDLVGAVCGDSGNGNDSNGGGSNGSSGSGSNRIYALPVFVLTSALFSFLF